MKITEQLVNDSAYFRFTDDEGRHVMSFRIRDYPYCCGITLLFDFWADNRLSVSDIYKGMVKWFYDYADEYRPTFQLVAIKEAKYLFSEEDDDDSDWGDEGKVDGWEEEYQFNNFISTLFEKLGAEVGYTFLNSNSDNECSVITFKNPRSWSDVENENDDVPELYGLEDDVAIRRIKARIKLINA